MSANSADIDEKLTKNGIPFLVNGTLFLLLKSTWYETANCPNDIKDDEDSLAGTGKMDVHIRI